VTHVAIVGGGIAGLAAAFELSLRGVPFTLLEASDRLGGLIRTEYDGGFTIEAGADSMLAQKRAGLTLCDELGLTPRLLSMQTPRTAYVLAGGVLHPLPSPSLLGIPASLRQLMAYGLLPPSARVRVALEPLVPRRRDRGDESIAAFFRRRFGRVAVERLAQPLLGGIHAGDIEALSLPALFPRLAEAERSGRGVLRWVRQTARLSGGGAFRSLAAGMGELVDSLRGRLAGHDIRLSVPVHGLEKHDGEWQVAADGSVVRAAAVVLACPAYAAARLLRPVDPDAADLCAAVPYVSTASVALGFPREAVAHPLEGSGYVVARSSAPGRVTACTWVSSKWEGRAPAGQVLLRAYLGGAHDPAAVDLSDDEMVDVAVRELSAILSISAPPSLARVFRWRAAGAQHEVGHRARVTALEERLRAHSGLFVAGSGFRSIGVPDCIADGRAVASAVAAASRSQV
jgi:protoporphyrinogen/coproporphyrinogen III oxidase